MKRSNLICEENQVFIEEDNPSGKVVTTADITNREQFSGRKAFWDYMGDVAIECLPS